MTFSLLKTPLCHDYPSYVLLAFTHWHLRSPFFESWAPSLQSAVTFDGRLRQAARNKKVEPLKMYYYGHSYTIQIPHIPLVILPASLDQTSLLILSLWSASPVRCLIYSLLFLLVSFLFCLVDGLGSVLGWGIDCVEDLMLLAFIVEDKGR